MTVEENQDSKMELDLTVQTPIIESKVEQTENSSDSDSDSDTDSSSSRSAGKNEDDIFNAESDEEEILFVPPKTKNELTEIPKEILEIPEFISAETEISPLGTVFANVENQTIIQSNRPHKVLDLDNLLVLEDRKVIGKIFDTFGPVESPFYSVYTSDQNAFQLGANVFYIPEDSKTVAVEKLRTIKGSDASNVFDEEVAEDEVEFSEDEKEALQKKQKKQKTVTKNEKNDPSISESDIYDPLEYNPLVRPSQQEAKKEELPETLPPLKNKSGLGRGRRGQMKKDVLVNESTIFIPIKQ